MTTPTRVTLGDCRTVIKAEDEDGSARLREEAYRVLGLGEKPMADKLNRIAEQWDRWMMEKDRG